MYGNNLENLFYVFFMLVLAPILGHYYDKYKARKNKKEDPE